jgi:hypothetical protein
MRTWRKTYPHLDEDEVTRELAAWFATPRTNAEIRARVSEYGGVAPDPYTPVLFARMLLPLVQLPPAGHWDDTGRGRLFALDPRPFPPRADAAALVLTRYLEAFGPASKRDAAAWAGVAQADFPFERVTTVSYRDEHGRELLDLPGRPLPPADTPLPPRLLANFDQPLLAYADRDRIIPPAIQPLKLTLSGDQTVTVDGRVAASWTLQDGQITVTPHVEIGRAARAAIREEGRRMARVLAPDRPRHEVVIGA